MSKATGECPRLVSLGIGISEAGITHHKDWDRASYDKGVCSVCLNCYYRPCYLEWPLARKKAFDKSFKV